MTRTATALFLALAAPALAAAATLEIPLAAPEHVEPVSVSVAVLDFTLDVPARAVTGVALRLEGTFANQFYVCGGVPYQNSDAAARLELRLGDAVADAPLFTVLHTFPAVDEPTPFAWEETLAAGEAGALTFLADGAGQVGLTIDALSVPNHGTDPCSPASLPVDVTAATLVVTYEQALPDGATSWGTLKARYR